MKTYCGRYTFRCSDRFCLPVPKLPSASLPSDDLSAGFPGHPLCQGVMRTPFCQYLFLFINITIIQVYFAAGVPHFVQNAPPLRGAPQFAHTSALAACAGAWGAGAAA